MASGTGGFAGRKRKPYRKYKPLPALILIVLLGAGALTVWLNAIASKPDLNEAVRCQPAASPPEDTSFNPLPIDALADTPPIPPDRVAVRVLNATDARGQAAMTTEGIRQLGFSQIAKPANDPAYDKVEAECHGQIRFGDIGAGAARTVSLIDPCLQLVKDNRTDATVDLAIGTDFNDVRPSSAALEILDTLSQWSEQQEGTGHSEQTAGGSGPAIDNALLEEAAPTDC